VRQITFSNPQLNEVAGHSFHDIKWKSKDGLEVEGIIILPSFPVDNKKLPLLTYIHGGPAFQFGLGFTVYPPGIPQASAIPSTSSPARVTPSSARTRAAAPLRRKIPQGQRPGTGAAAITRNIMSGVDHLIAQGIADPERLGVMGWSYGGYMTSWVITQTHRFQGGVSRRRRHQPVEHVGHTDIPLFWSATSAGRRGRTPRYYADHSPMTFAGNIKTPTLIQHGEKGRARAAGAGAGVVRGAEAVGGAGRVRGLSTAGP